MIHANTVHRVLAVRSDLDPVLHHLAPIGLAASVGTSLVVDLDETAPALPGPTLADLLERGASQAELTVTEGKVAILGNGGVRYREAIGMIDELADRWPFVVFRAGTRREPIPLVQVEPAYPSPLGPSNPGRLVIQLLSRSQRSGLGLVDLPPLRRTQIHGMLAGRLEPRWRWVRTWRSVWERPWE